MRAGGRNSGRHRHLRGCRVGGRTLVRQVGFTAILALALIMAIGALTVTSVSSPSRDKASSLRLVMIPQGRHWTVFEQAYLGDRGREPQIGLIWGYRQARPNRATESQNAFSMTFKGAPNRVIVEYRIASKRGPFRLFLATPELPLSLVLPSGWALAPGLNPAWRDEGTVSLLPKSRLPFNLYRTQSEHPGAWVQFTIGRGQSNDSSQRRLTYASAGVAYGLFLATAVGAVILGAWRMRQAAKAHAISEGTDNRRY